jgi:hypothetical protein
MGAVYDIKNKKFNEVKMGRIEPVIQPIENVVVAMDYMQDRFALHECIATGSLDHGKRKIKFEVHHSFDRVYVTFPGMKGSIPNIGISVRNLVQGAFDAALFNDLI